MNRRTHRSLAIRAARSEATERQAYAGCGKRIAAKALLITHNPHPVRSPSRKATRWDRKRLLNRFESGTKRRAGRQISVESLRCSSNMSFVRNQEGACDHARRAEEGRHRDHRDRGGPSAGRAGHESRVRQVYAHAQGRARRERRPHRPSHYEAGIHIRVAQGV